MKINTFKTFIQKQYSSIIASESFETSKNVFNVFIATPFTYPYKHVSLHLRCLRTGMGSSNTLSLKGRSLHLAIGVAELLPVINFIICLAEDVIFSKINTKPNYTENELDNDLALSYLFEAIVEKTENQPQKINEYFKKKTKNTAKSNYNYPNTLQEHAPKELLYIHNRALKIQKILSDTTITSNITSLSLNRMQVKVLPTEICNLTSLKSLDINDCPIESFPENFCNLVNLERLCISNVPIKDFPENYEKLTKLSTLIIKRTRIEKFSDDFFEKFTKLKYFDYSKNFRFDELHKGYNPHYTHCSEPTLSSKNIQSLRDLKTFCNPPLPPLPTLEEPLPG